MHSLDEKVVFMESTVPVQRGGGVDPAECLLLTVVLPRCPFIVIIEKSKVVYVRKTLCVHYLLLFIAFINSFEIKEQDISSLLASSETLTHLFRIAELRPLPKT